MERVNLPRDKVALKNEMEWYRLRCEMYEHLMVEVRARLGEDRGDLLRYRKKYDTDTSGKWKVSGREELFRAARRYRVVLLGDFHALQQSQKAHLRILEQLILDQKPLVLGVECVRSTHQKSVDQFLADQITEEQFLRKVRWKKEWGFPWEHYRRIFIWAKENRISIIALNSDHESLRIRDKATAQILKTAFLKFPGHQFVVIFGDLHLQSEALPKEIEKVLKEPVLRIFQNVEKASFQILKKGLDHQVDVIRYDKKSYAVLSVPPWVKWQNFLLWSQNLRDRELETEDGTDSVARMVTWLSRELGFNTDLGGLTVYTAGERDLWQKILENAESSDLPWIKIMIEDGRSFYLSAAGWGYLARPSVNHAASLAMQYVHDRMCGGAAVNFKMPEDFLRMIWIEAVAFFGSKIINPKRKSDTLSDLQGSLSSRQADDRGREALRLALSQKLRETSVSERTAITSFRPRRRSSWVAASHLLGALAGERLYHGFRKGLISSRTLRALLEKPVGHSSFPLIYPDLLEIIDSLPAPFRSKREKL